MVASENKGKAAPFVIEQMLVLQQKGCVASFFGLKGYLKNLPALKQKIKEFQPDVIHAHYGLSGLFANLQRQVPVVTTYHGSDINERKVLPFSKAAMRLSAWNVFVSQKTIEIAQPKGKCTLLPCGIDMTELQLTGKNEARRKMGLETDKKYVLFAGAFDNQVKNSPLAKETVAALKDDNVELMELKGYSREEVTLMMCATDVLLMTSFSEGSPQVIKEAMACDCPIVSVDVGDVKERTEGVEGCYVSDTRNPQELSVLLKKALVFKGKTRGREKLLADGLDNESVVQRLIGIYENVAER